MALGNFLSSELLSNYALSNFENNNSLISTSSRNVQKDFTQKTYMPGDTVNVRAVNRFIAREGTLAQPNGPEEQSTPMSLKSFNSAFEVNPRDLTLKVDDFNDRYLRPAVQSLIGKVESYIADLAVTQVANFVGSNLAPISSFNNIAAAKAKMLKLAMPTDGANPAYAALTINNGLALKSNPTVYNAFNNAINSEVSLRYMLAQYSGFDIFENQSLINHTAGSFDAPGAVQIDGTVTAGNTITLKGFTPNALAVLVPGDLITVAGSFQINPVNYQSTGDLVQFVVQNTVNADGAGVAVVIVSPSIITDVNNVMRNVVNPLANNAVVLQVGSYACNMAYCKTGLELACVPYFPIDVVNSYTRTSDKGLSITVSSQSDILSFSTVMRVDILVGASWYNNYAVKLISQF
jgi:hypothetical protein